MENLLYCIYDRVTGCYGMPNVLINVGAAKRWFRNLCSSSPIGNDCELYELGQYNTSTGIISVYEKPYFVEKFSSEVVSEK